MSKIDIRHPHSLPKAKARKAIEEVAKKLAERFQMDWDWTGDVLNFSRSGVDGHIELGKDDYVGSRGPITEKIQSAFFDIVNGRNPKYAHWLTKVSE